MLIRCEHCGSVLPGEATKCYKCNTPHQPIPPHVIKTVTVDDPTLEMRKQKWYKYQLFFAILMLVSLVSTIVSLVTWIILVENGYLKYEKYALCIFLGSTIVLALVVFVVVKWEKSLEPKTVTIEENRPPRVDPVVYEQMMRDFIQNK